MDIKVKSIVTIGKLIKVPLRVVWEREDTGFTPWLLHNPEYLSDALGIDVELTAAEHGVGPYSVDLIGRDLSNNAVVIVENQIEKTDHIHLGQLITYAANTDAVVVVWIAKKFTEEHRQAIDYMNSLSGDSGKGRFFGIEVSAVRIGESEPAVQFDVVARPNDSHTAQAEAIRELIEPTGRRLMYRNIWKLYLEKIEKMKPGLTNRKQPWNSNWFDVSKSICGLAHVSLVFNRKSQVNVQLYINGGDAVRNRALFSFLNDKKDQIEKEIGASLIWESPEGRLYCRIIIFKPGECDISDIDSYEEIVDWLAEYHVRFITSLTPYIEKFADNTQE